MNDAVALIARIEADLASLRALLAAPSTCEPEPDAEDWLAPCQLADRLGLGEAYIRRLIGRGLKQGSSGFERRGGRLYATPDAVRSIWMG